jgi:hypothetical protein
MRGKGRVERQVIIVRDHVLAGRSFSSLGELDQAFLAWVPARRRTVHRTHGEVIGVRAQRDHAALQPVPARPYVVANRHLRHVGKDCLVAFEASLYSVPAARVFHRQLVEVRASAATISLHATVPDNNGITLLAVHPRAVGRGARIVDPEHWKPLPDGHTRATTTSGESFPGDAPGGPRDHQAGHPSGALRFLLARADAANITVGHRPLSVYDQITGTRPFTIVPAANPKDSA